MKTTSTIRYKGKSYRAHLEENEDVRIEVREGNGDWSQLAVGMFQHGLLDCGDEASRIPEPVWERLHDALEAVAGGEGDEDDDVEDE